MHNIQKIKNIFYNDRQIRHQLNVLNAIGVEIELTIKVIENRFFIEPERIKIAQSYLDVDNIINTPSIKISGYKLESIELFEIRKPNRETLKQSAIRGGFSPRISNFEMIVERIYQEEIQDVKKQEKLLTQRLQTTLSQNLIFLQEAVNDFIALYEGRL